MFLWMEGERFTHLTADPLHLLFFFLNKECNGEYPHDLGLSFCMLLPLKTSRCKAKKNRHTLFSKLQTFKLAEGHLSSKQHSEV